MFKRTYNARKCVGDAIIPSLKSMYILLHVKNDRARIHQAIKPFHFENYSQVFVGFSRLTENIRIPRFMIKILFKTVLCRVVAFTKKIQQHLSVFRLFSSYGMTSSNFLLSIKQGCVWQNRRCGTWSTSKSIATISSTCKL